MPKDPQKNGYEDSDFQQIIDEIEGYEAEKRSIMAAAAGECSGLAKKIANAKKTAKALKIPGAVLGAVLKQRKLEEQLQDLANGIPEDLAEVYEDAAGQFSFLKPAADEPPAPTPAKAAASKAAKRAKINQDAEQEDGQRVLDELGTTH